MKAIIFFVILPFLGFSQGIVEKKLSTSMLDSIEYDLTSNTLAPSAFYLPFKKIEVIDAWFDTCKLGFELKKWYSYISPDDFRKIKLKGGIGKAIRDYYNDYYQLCLKDSANELLMVLKTLWVDNLPTSDFKREQGPEIIWEAYQNIYVKVEYYLKKGIEYYPLKRVDTVYQLTEQNIHSKAFNFRKNNLSLFLFTLKSLIETCDFAELINRNNYKTKLTLNSIDSFNHKRYQLPVLTTGNVKKGIFLGVKDFINNTPVNDSGFIFSKNDIPPKMGDKNNEIPYFMDIKEAGVRTWRSTNTEILRVGNTFEFFIVSDVYMSKSVAGSMLNLILNTENWGDKGFERLNTDNWEIKGYERLKFHLGDGARLFTILTPRQINMETGDIY